MEKDFVVRSIIKNSLYEPVLSVQDMKRRDKRVNEERYAKTLDETLKPIKKGQIKYCLR